MLPKWLLVTICLGMGLAQAWDSGVLGTPIWIQALVAGAIVLPVAALLSTESYGVRALAVAGAFVLLTVARIASPISLPTLHFVAFIPAVVIFYSHLVATKKAQPST